MFTHIDQENNPTMVDVSSKSVTDRFAKAGAFVELPESVLAHFKDGDIKSKKGPVFQTAIIAGVQAMKRTSELIPFCHQLNLEGCKINISLNEQKQVYIESEARLHSKTGVEMEALTGASVAALTIYDMCKAFSHEIKIKEVFLLEKAGGKSNYKKELQ